MLPSVTDRSPAVLPTTVRSGREPLVISQIGPVIGTHVGPGLLGTGAIPSTLCS